MSDVTVLMIENGPLKVMGGIALVDDGSGEPVAAGDGDPVFLCRCGGSQNKPFCDGTHKRNGFQGTSAATAARMSGVASSGSLTIGGDLEVHRLGFGAMRIVGAGVWGRRRTATRCWRCCAARLDSASTSSTRPTATARTSPSSSSPRRCIPIPNGLVIATKGGLTRSGAGRVGAQRAPRAPARGRVSARCKRPARRAHRPLPAARARPRRAPTRSPSARSPSCRATARSATSASPTCRSSSSRRHARSSRS